MKLKLKIMVLVALALGLTAQSSVAQTSSEPLVSGEIVNGLRILTITPGQKNTFVVYRGDYVLLESADNKSFELVIPALKIQQPFPAKEGDKGYVKMKQVGTYAFTAGAATGTIQVIDYVAASYTELSAAAAAQILQNTNPLILDVRTQQEFQQGHIQGANLLPVQVLQQNIAQLEPYKNQDILIYCASGNRSTVASRLLIEAGFMKIYNLRHGFSDWAQRGHPVVR